MNNINNLINRVFWISMIPSSININKCGLTEWFLDRKMSFSRNTVQFRGDRMASTANWVFSVILWNRMIRWMCTETFLLTKEGFRDGRGTKSMRSTMQRERKWLDILIRAVLWMKRRLMSSWEPIWMKMSGVHSGNQRVSFLRSIRGSRSRSKVDS